MRPIAIIPPITPPTMLAIGDFFFVIKLFEIKVEVELGGEGEVELGDEDEVKFRSEGEVGLWCEDGVEDEDEDEDEGEGEVVEDEGEDEGADEVELVLEVEFEAGGKDKSVEFEEPLLVVYMA